MPRKCRTRVRAPEPDEPFLGNDDDADAYSILLAANKLIIDDAGPPAYPNQPLGEFMTPQQIEGLTVTFNAMDYLADRKTFTDQSPQRYGYLVIS